MQPKNKYTDSPILVMGVGNWLMADEGVGVHAAERLEKEQLPGVDVVDGGTGGFHLLEYFEKYERIILVDATLDNYPPGTIRLIRPRFASDFPQAMSSHDIGLKDLVSAIQLLDRHPDVRLFVVSIKSIQDQGVQLTPDIEAVMPKLLELICAEIESMQIENETLIETGT